MRALPLPDLPPRGLARLPLPVRSSLASFASRVRAMFGARVEDLALFGSYARGEAREGSDADVLVVIDSLRETERRAVFDLAYDVFTEHLVRVSPLAWSTEERDLHARREYLITRELARDAVPL